MFRPISPESKVSDLFHVEQSSNEPSPPRPNTSIFLNSTEMSGSNTGDKIKLSSIASSEPQIHSDSNKPTMPYGFGRQLPSIPPGLIDLNLPPNLFIILATMAIANPTAEGPDKNYSPQSSEPLEPSPIITPQMNPSTIEG